MKKRALIISVISLVVFASLFYITNSFKTALIAFGLLVLYLLWVVVVELNLFKSKEEKLEERNRIRDTNKSALKKASKDNPNIR